MTNSFLEPIVWKKLVTQKENGGSSMCYAVINKLTALMMTMGLKFKPDKINH